MRRARIFAAAALLAIGLGPARADEAACTAFAWPLATELGWLRAGDAADAARFAAPPARAIAVTLAPMKDFAFVIQPSGRARPEDAETFAGILAFDGVAAPGFHQVTLSGPGWIDVIQDGNIIKEASHSGQPGCPGMRKSVRFLIGPGPFQIQLSRVPEKSLRLAIRAAE